MMHPLMRKRIYASNLWIILNYTDEVLKNTPEPSTNVDFSRYVIESQSTKLPTHIISLP